MEYWLCYPLLVDEALVKHLYWESVVVWSDYHITKYVCEIYFIAEYPS